MAEHTPPRPFVQDRMHTYLGHKEYRYQIFNYYDGECKTKQFDKFFWAKSDRQITPETGCTRQCQRPAEAKIWGH
jgi:hypothetical protein